MKDLQLQLAVQVALGSAPAELARLVELYAGGDEPFQRRLSRQIRPEGVRALEWPVDGLPPTPIASLAGIERLHALAICRLHALAPGIDVEPLAGLRALREVALGGAIASVGFVAALRELRVLELCGPIRDLSPLADLPALEAVSLVELDTDDLSALASLPKLGQLRLRWAAGAPGPSLGTAQGFVDGLAPGVELDAVFPAGEIRANRPRRVRNRDLEAMIRADPDDPGAYLVYADWLQAHNDPLGQLIVYDHQLAAHPDEQLAEIRARHFTAHRARFLNKLEDRDGYRWRLGYLVRADVDDPEELDALMRTPAALFLTSLRIRVLRIRMMEAITRGPAPPLRELELVAPRTLHIDASSLWKRYPELRRVALDGAFHPGAIALPHATSVEIRGEDGTLRDQTIVALDDASWPMLEQLTVAGLFDQVPRSILDAKDTPHLRRLRLEARWPDPICMGLASSRVVGQLTELEIVSPDGVGNEGARALLAAKSRFAHLDVFDVGIGRVNPADARALAAMVRART